ncbi:hypothetical protein ACFL35_01295 [Candidatus Riflebacteria bacterium]
MVGRFSEDCRLKCEKILNKLKVIFEEKILTRTKVQNYLKKNQSKDYKKNKIIGKKLFEFLAKKAGKIEPCPSAGSYFVRKEGEIFEVACPTHSEF